MRGNKEDGEMNIRQSDSNAALLGDLVSRKDSEGRGVDKKKRKRDKSPDERDGEYREHKHRKSKHRKAPTLG